MLYVPRGYGSISSVRYYIMQDLEVSKMDLLQKVTNNIHQFQVFVLSFLYDVMFSKYLTLKSLGDLPFWD